MRFVCCFVTLTADVPKAVVVDADDLAAAIGKTRALLMAQTRGEWALLFLGDRQVALVERDAERDVLQ